MAPVFDRPFDDLHDKGVLAGCFIVGLLAIIILRGGWLGSKPIGVITLFDMSATVIVVGIIILYCSYILLTKARTGVSIDRASDNAYYLGLLFTLISLSVSLLKMLSNMTVVDSIAVNSALLPDFGLALFSTIAGIVARIFLQQMRPDPEDLEGDATQQLAALMQSMQSSVQNLVANLDGLSNQTRLSMGEIVDRTGEMMAKVTNDVSVVILDSTKRNEELLSGVAKSVNELGIQSATQIEKLVMTSDTVATAMQKFNLSIGGFEELNTQINKAAERHTNLATALESAAGTIETTFANLSVPGLVAGVDNSVQKFGELGEEMHGIKNQFVELNELLQGTNNTVGDLKKNLEGKGNEIAVVTEAADQAASEYVSALTAASQFLRGKNKPGS